MNTPPAETARSEPDDRGNYALVYTWPFWVWVSLSDVPIAAELQLPGGQRIRLYPPFRSAPLGRLPRPAPDFEALPFLPGVQSFLPPSPELDRGGTGMTIGYSPRLYGLTSSGEMPPGVTQLMADSLRVDFFDVTWDAFGEPAEAFNRRIQELLRVRTRQWWIGREAVVRDLQVCIPIDDAGRLGGEVLSVAGLRTPYGDEMPLTQSVWQRILRDLRDNFEVPLHRVLLLDAINYAVWGDARRAVLDAAIACEQARDVAFESLWKLMGNRKRYSLQRVVGHNRHLPDHIGDLMDRRFGRSFSREYPTDYESLEKLWLARNNVAHGAEPSYVQAGVRHEIDAATAAKLARSAETCVRWLEDAATNPGSVPAR